MNEIRQPSVSRGGFSLNCEGRSFTGSTLDDRSAELARLCLSRNIGRLAVVGNDVTSIAVALNACKLADCELLLHRGDEAGGRELSSELKVDAWLDQSGSIHMDKRGSRGSRAFNLLIPTSGTTGPPKWARHSLETLLSSARVRSSGLAGNRFLMTFHAASFAGIQFLLSAMTAGGELCYLKESNTVALADFARRFPPQVVSGTPSFWRGFLLALGADAAGLPLRYITLGGEIVDQTILDLLRSKFPQARIRHIYATTEVGSVAPVEDGVAGLPAAWLRRTDMDFALAIFGGYLFVRGKRLTQGYEFTGDNEGLHYEQGFACTGDLVEVVGDRILFRGRSDATINVGGFKVNPEEVEQALLSVPGVADAFVYGLPSPLLGFVVGADVVPTAAVDAKSFQQRAILLLRERLPRHKVPVRINVVAALRHTPAGKLSRAKQHAGS